MSTCKDCLHYEVCVYWCDSVQETFETKTYIPFDDNNNDYCQFFKNKADYVAVVRCENCKHSCELAPHSEIGPYYRHCNLWRGEETKNVWHKYKKYYADYSIVEPTDFCSYGEKESEVKE